MQKTYSNKFKFKLAIEALKEDHTLAELSVKYKVSSQVIGRWKKELMDKGQSLFALKYNKSSPSEDIEKLHATIGRLKVENDFLSTALDHKK